MSAASYSKFPGPDLDYVHEKLEKGDKSGRHLFDGEFGHLEPEDEITLVTRGRYNPVCYHHLAVFDWFVDIYEDLGFQVDQVKVLIDDQSPERLDSTPFSGMERKRMLEESAQELGFDYEIVGVPHQKIFQEDIWEGISNKPVYFTRERDHFDNFSELNKVLDEDKTVIAEMYARKIGQSLESLTKEFDPRGAFSWGSEAALQAAESIGKGRGGLGCHYVPRENQEPYRNFEKKYGIDVLSGPTSGTEIRNMIVNGDERWRESVTDAAAEIIGQSTEAQELIEQGDRYPEIISDNKYLKILSSRPINLLEDKIPVLQRITPERKLKDNR